MYPKVFVSSTVNDLEAIRDSVRNLLISLGYAPIMSEYNDFGSTPTESATNACYSAVAECDIGIVIIAKRYGTIDKATNKSVTHSEYTTMRENGIPHFVFVESEVISFQKIYTQNKGRKPSRLKYPDVDHPDALFGFIREISHSETGNFRIEFDGQNSLCEGIKSQLALHFASLLRVKRDPINKNVDKLLNEFMALRRTMEDSGNSRAFLRTSNKLLEDSAKHYRQFLEKICGGFEEGVVAVVEHKSFEALLKSRRRKWIKTADIAIADAQKTMSTFTAYSFWSLSSSAVAGFGENKAGEIVITQSAWDNFCAVHASAKA